MTCVEPYFTQLESAGFVTILGKPLLNSDKQHAATVNSRNIDVGSGTDDGVPLVSPATFPVLNLPPPFGTPMSNAKYSPLLFVKSLGVKPPAFMTSN